MTGAFEIRIYEGEYQGDGCTWGGRTYPDYPWSPTDLMMGHIPRLTSYPVNHNACSAFSTTMKYYDDPSLDEAKSDPESEPASTPATPITKLHRSNLPPEPLNYRELAKRPHMQDFKIIPTTWVFRYKFDEEGCLTKYNTRLCARSDLQKTEEDTYAATLAAKVFRALMAYAHTHHLLKKLKLDERAHIGHLVW